MSNPYFGDPLPAPAYESASQVSTPVGEPCQFCPERIADGDQGFMINSVETVEGEDQLRPRPVHRECLIRNTAGTVACLHGTCTCRVDPPDPAAYRDEGRATIAWLRRRGGV